MKYLFWVLPLLYTTIIYAYEQHCIDPANCQFYPIHGCYATDVGLVCRHRSQPGFEMSIDPLYTFYYSPFEIRNDTGLPCESIPITDELVNYVDFRGPNVISVNDLKLIGNCSKMSYCDVQTKTCQPKLPLGSQCQYNMQCYFGIDGIPGHCSNKTCSIRQDIPNYYYNTPRWTMGEQWKSAVIAVLLTGSIAACLIIGRVQVKKIYDKFKVFMEKWQNPDTIPSVIQQQQQGEVVVPFIENEQVWNQHHDQQQKWWKQVPGMNWVYSKLSKRSGGHNEQYYRLNNRSDEPPPYQSS